MGLPSKAVVCCDTAHMMRPSLLDFLLLTSTICSCFLSQADFVTFYHEHGVRLSNLEDILRKLTEKSEVFLLDFIVSPRSSSLNRRAVNCS
jgi:hypothetical protein